MKRVLLFILLLSLLCAPSVSAHGGPPFILVNGNPNQPNPAGSGSVFFKVPNELGAQNYVVNETVNFAIDTSLLPVDPNQINEGDFFWDFANGKTATGLKVSTSYTKSGSYIVVLKVKDPSYQDPIELESMQLNILPTKSSSAPTAIIKVNGKVITDPFKEPVLIDKNSEVELSAEDSKGGIRSYKWDFGDGTKLTEGVKVKHKFDFSKPYAYSFFPVLRVEDQSGIFADAVVQIATNESGENATATDSTSAKKNGTNYMIYALASVVILSILAGFFLIKRKK